MTCFSIIKLNSPRGPTPISQMLSYWLSQLSCSPTKATVFKLHLPHSEPSSPELSMTLKKTLRGVGGMDKWVGGSWVAWRSAWVMASQLVAGTIKTVAEAVIVQNVYTQMAALCTFSPGIPHPGNLKPFQREISGIVIHLSGAALGKLIIYLFCHYTL